MTIFKQKLKEAVRRRAEKTIFFSVFNKFRLPHLQFPVIRRPPDFNELPLIEKAIERGAPISNGDARVVLQHHKNRGDYFERNYRQARAKLETVVDAFRRKLS